MARRSRAAGIGLAVCRQIVDAYGGTIRAEPADGAGTVMGFTVPTLTFAVKQK